MSRCRLRELGVLAPLACVGVACGAFGETDVPARDGNAGGGAQDDAAALDGGASGSIGDALPRLDGACIPSAPGFAEAFDSAWEQRWVRQGGIDVDPAVGHASAPSLLVDIPANPVARWAERAIGLPCHTRAEAQINFNAIGAGDIDVLGIEDGLPASRGVLVMVRGANLVAEYPTGASNVGQVALSATPLHDWYRIALEVDLPARTWTISFAAVTKTGPLPADWPATDTLLLKVGASWVSNVTSPWTFHLDGVAFSSP